MPPIEDRAICLRHWDWSETSQTAVLLSREHGLVRVLAKGSKRPKSVFSGGLEVLTVGAMQAILKPDGALALLTSWELAEPMLHLRSSLGAWHGAQIGGEVAARMLSEHDPHSGVFDALEQLLAALADGKYRTTRIVRFLWLILTDCGYRPELHHDVRTGLELERAQQYGFAPAMGGLTADPGPDSPELHDMRNPIWRMRAQTVEYITQLTDSDHPIDNPAPNVGITSDTDTHTRALKLTLAYIQYLIGAELMCATPYFQRG